MRRIIALLLCFARPLYAISPQWVDCSGTPTTNATVYGGFGASLSGQAVFNATEGNRQVPWAVAGTWSNLRVVSAADPGNGHTLSITLRTNGASSLLTCTINGSAGGTSTKCQDLSIAHSSTTIAGDLINFKVTASNAATVGATRISAIFTPTTANQYVIAFGGNTPGAGVGLFYGGNSQSFTTSNLGESIISPPGTIDYLYCNVLNAPGAGDTYTFTVSTNGVVTTTSCQISGTGTSCNDTAHSIKFIPGGRINIKNQASAAISGSICQAQCTIRFLAANNGEFPISDNTGSDVNSAVRWTGVSGSQTSPNATEALGQDGGLNITPGLVLKNMYAFTTATTGAGASWAITLRSNSATPAGSPNCTISNSTICNDTTDIYQVADDDILDVQFSPASSPAAGAIRVGFTGFVGQANPNLIPGTD